MFKPKVLTWSSLQISPFAFELRFLSESSTLTIVVVTPDRRPYFSSESIHLEFLTQTSLTIPLRSTTSRNNLFNPIPPAHFSLPLTRIFKLSLTLNRLFLWFPVTHTTLLKLLHVVTTNSHLLQHTLV
ncbi:hypothetical protein F2Q70_00001248 [Brassica cretica]|uniref:Uncharacterized protein n=1 Tax=Brassica cretica TaxID=69181 RepID=A0A8S9J2R0_BRACR|nr:hypothetical protein F2Q70_00001248 [Brassica cretica]